MTMRRFLAGIALALLFVGAGCGNGGTVVATKDMMPDDFDVMPGLVPANEQAWRLVNADVHPRIDTFWRTPRLFDQVQAYYMDMIGKEWGLATHTVANKDEVRIYWGLYVDVKGGPARNQQFIAIKKAQQDGMTSVEVFIEPRYQ